MNTTRRVLPVWAVLFLVTAAYSGFSWNTALSSALSVAVLTAVVLATEAAGWTLVWMLFLMYFGIAYVNTLDEAVLFQVMSPAVAAQLLANGATTTFTVAVLLALSVNRMQVKNSRPDFDPIPRSPLNWVWKLAAGSLLYCILYLAAGAGVHPFIEKFYAIRWLPSLGQLIAIQFCRGLLSIGIALPFLKRMAGQRLQAGVILGLCYSVLGGIAPLLLPNPYMPPKVRFAHSIEVGVSNFLFGMVISYLFVESTTTSTRKLSLGVSANIGH